MANENTGWLLGQFFGYANELQRLYMFCDNPNNLKRRGGIGSNAFELARTKKVNDAIMSMSDHLKIYVDWVNSNAQTECAYGRKIVEYIGKVTAALGAKELSEKLSDDEKAQMLLGFLSIEHSNLYEVSKKDKED